MTKPFMIASGDRKQVDEEIRAEIVEELRSDELKPWTVVSRVAGDEHGREAVNETLRLLTLRGDIMPTADGDLRVDDRE